MREIKQVHYQLIKQVHLGPCALTLSHKLLYGNGIKQALDVHQCDTGNILRPLEQNLPSDDQPACFLIGQLIHLILYVL